MTNIIKIKKGDKVLVLAGKDKGKTGTVERVYPKKAQIVITGINIVKKHVKVSKKNPSGGVVEASKPLPVGKVALVCPNCGKKTRIGVTISGKEKSRVCLKCKKVISEKAKETKEK